METKTEDVRKSTGVIKTFQTVGELAAYLATKDPLLGVMDNYGNYLTVHDPLDSGEDLWFAPTDLD